MPTDHHDSPATPPRSDFPADRPKAFVDAVVAIAMTLLILPLMESASEIGDVDGGIREWFPEHGGQIVTFVISFAVIGVFWLAQHRVFARVEKVSNTLLWLMFAWLLTIVWLPVATALTGTRADAQTDVVLMYIGSMFASSLIWMVVRFFLAFRPRLHTFTPTETVDDVADAIANVLTFVIATLLVVVVPAMGYYALLAKFLSTPARRLIEPFLRRWRPAPGTAPS